MAGGYGDIVFSKIALQNAYANHNKIAPAP